MTVENISARLSEHVVLAQAQFDALVKRIGEHGGEIFYVRHRLEILETLAGDILTALANAAAEFNELSRRCEEADEDYSRAQHACARDTAGDEHTEYDTWLPGFEGQP